MAPRHENLAFYVGVPVIVLICAKIFGPASSLPSLTELRHRTAWHRLRWLLLGAVLVGVTGIYYLAFLLSLLAICGAVSAIARRRPGTLVMAAVFGAVGLAASLLANLPTLLYRWQHAANLLGVPVRQPGESEGYPLRIVEMLSPVTAHRFGPFAALADRLYEPGREGLASANLGLAATIGFVCAITIVLVRAVRGAEQPRLVSRGPSRRHHRRVAPARVEGWAESPARARGPSGRPRLEPDRNRRRVREPGRVCTPVRSTPRGHPRRRWTRDRLAWTVLLASSLLVGVLDQASPAQMPIPAPTQLWQSRQHVRCVHRTTATEARHGVSTPGGGLSRAQRIQQISPYDLIKEAYLHSKTLRWSAGGMRGRDGEWQFPASLLPMRELVRGMLAMGFSGLTLDRKGFADNGDDEVGQLQRLLGPPVAESNDRLVGWDLRPVARALLANMSASAQRLLAQQMLNAPRLYLTTDTEPIVGRGERHNVCREAGITLVNPGSRAVAEQLEITLARRQSEVRGGQVQVGNRISPILARWRANVIPVDVLPGTTTVHVTVDTGGVRCQSTPTSALPSISATLQVVR